jgi:hypothetical protein
MFLYLATISVVAAAFLLPAPAIAALLRDARSVPGPSTSLHTPALAQDDDDNGDEEPIPTAQVDKYIAVYSAMQKNHSLSVEQAASKQGLSVDDFRSLEDKIERNPVVHQRVLDALKASATGKPASSTSSESD